MFVEGERRLRGGARMGWAVGLLGCGCATAGSFQTAHTVGPGGWELGADGSALVIVDQTADMPYLVLPRVAGRVGVSERTELSGSVGLDGVTFGPRVQLTDTDDEGVIVTVGASAKALPFPTGESGLAMLAGAAESVYVGLPTSEVGQVVLVGRAAQDVAFGSGNQATLLWGGGSLGYSWFADERFRLAPEVGAMVPMLVVDESGDTTGFPGAVVQVGLGFAYGRRR